MPSLKKIIFLQIFLLAFPTWGGQFISDAKRDVLIFMMADNDLAEQAQDDLREIGQALSTITNSNVIVDVHLPGQSFRQVNNHKTYINSENSPINKLTAFLTWYKSKKRSSEQILILWGHGQGPLSDSRPTKFGGVFTDTKNYNATTTTKLGELLRQFPSSILIFDMCLMQNLTVFEHLKNASTTIIGSAQIQHFIGLPYDKIIKAIDTLKNDVELNNQIVTDTTAIMPNTNFTFSSLYLTHTAEIREKLDLLNKRLKLELQSDSFKEFVLSNYVIDLPTFPGGSIDIGMYLSILKLADVENSLFSKRVQNRIREVQEAISYALIKSSFGKDYYDGRLNYFIEYFKGISISKDDTVFNYE